VTESTIRLVSELRREIPAPVQMCHSAITAANGNIRQAYDLVVQNLVDDLVSRTGATRDQAMASLAATGFDTERSFQLWRRENPGPAPSPRERLVSGRELAASIPCPTPEFRCWAHVIPISNGYELRLITHLARYTEESYGWD